jgi:hypothetical protein
MTEDVCQYNAEYKNLNQIHIQKDNYDNSFEKVFAEGIGQIKLRPVTDKTDFSNLKVTKIPWNFWLKYKPYQVVRVDGYPHQYDNCYYCYPISDEDTPYNSKLIPFDMDWRNSLGNPKMEIYTKPSYRYKWDECQTSFKFFGKLFFDDNVLLAHESGKNWGECFSQLQVALNKLESHAICFFHRDWRNDVIGRKIYYNNLPYVIFNIYESSESVLSFSISPTHSTDISECIHSKTSYDIDVEALKGLMVTWDCPNIDWFRTH